MSSVCRGTIVALAIAVGLGAAARPALRVCADPNNLPFSNRDGAGFENAIAQLIGRDLGRPITYFWSPQRRGFMRNTLDAGRCDVVIGVPASYGLASTTHPYYRSAYAFVTRRSRHLRIDSFDDPRLKTLTIGVQITGNDYNNPPAAHALASRHIIDNVRGYAVYGDYSKPDPQRDLVDAVADRRVDVAVVWGPLAGYYAKAQRVPLDVVPVRADRENTSTVFAFDIAMGVRRDDTALRDALDAVILKRRDGIRRILESYGVPLR